MAYGERTNADRAAAARVAFEASSHSKQSNNEITNLYDLVCDLLHLADTMPPEGNTYEGHRLGPGDDEVRAGYYVLDMARYHYEAELDEEAEDDKPAPGEFTEQARALYDAIEARYSEMAHSEEPLGRLNDAFDILDELLAGIEDED